MLTKIDEEGIVLRADRPGLIISSTSWTEDEDFSMLLTSLQGNIILSTYVVFVIKTIF